VSSEQRKLFSYFKYKSKGYKQTSDFLYNNVVITNSKEKAKILNRIFNDVFKNNPKENPPYFPAIVNNRLKKIRTTPSEVKFHLNNIKSSRGPGFDGLSGILLKNISEEICLAVSDIFNYIFEKKEWPEI
jgi:hypothetical protein